MHIIAFMVLQMTPSWFSFDKRAGQQLARHTMELKEKYEDPIPIRRGFADQIAG